MKSLFKFKPSWLLSFAFFAFAFVLILHYYQPPEETLPTLKTTGNPQQQLTKSVIALTALAQICLDIDENNEPLASKNIFGNPDYVYCYVDFENNPEDQQIKFIWKLNGKTVHQDPKWIDAGSDVVWSKYEFPSQNTGQWSTFIIDQNGLEICRTQFTVKG